MLIVKRKKVKNKNEIDKIWNVIETVIDYLGNNLKLYYSHFISKYVLFT